MERSSPRASHAGRFALFSLFILGVLLTAVGSRPWAAGKVTRAVATADAYTENSAAPKAPPTAVPNYTLNKYVYPGSATFTSLSPTLATTSPQIGT